MLAGPASPPSLGGCGSTGSGGGGSWPPRLPERSLQGTTKMLLAFSEKPPPVLRLGEPYRRSSHSVRGLGPFSFGYCDAMARSESRLALASRLRTQQTMRKATMMPAPTMQPKTAPTIVFAGMDAPPGGPISLLAAFPGGDGPLGISAAGGRTVAMGPAVLVEDDSCISGIGVAPPPGDDETRVRSVVGDGEATTGAAVDEPGGAGLCTGSAPEAGGTAGFALDTGGLTMGGAGAGVSMAAGAVVMAGADVGADDGGGAGAGRADEEVVGAGAVTGGGGAGEEVTGAGVALEDSLLDLTDGALLGLALLVEADDTLPLSPPVTWRRSRSPTSSARLRGWAPMGIRAGGAGRRAPLVELALLVAADSTDSASLD